MTGPGERLVTVVLTVAVPADADAAAGLVADATVSTALHLVSAAGVEGHLPVVPGSTVLRRADGMPWLVQAVTEGSATLRDLAGTWYSSADPAGTGFASRIR